MDYDFRSLDADQQKDLRKIGEKVNFNELKEAVRELNDAIEKYNGLDEEAPDLGKVRIVGLKKPDMYLQFADIIYYMDEVKFDGVPAAAVDYYNKTDPEEEEVEETDEVEEEEVEETDEVEEEEVEDKPEPAKKEPAAKKKDAKDKKPATEKKVKNFDSIKETLKDPQNPTAYFDKLTLSGGSVENLLARFKKWITDNEIPFKGMNTPSSIKRHIEYRQERGYIYEDDSGKIKLVGYEG